jgi:hypothetical protein
MAKTFNASTGEMEHGIEFTEKNGVMAIVTSNKGKILHLRFCSQHPPKRVNALTLLDGELYGTTIRNEHPKSNVILVHILGAKDILPNSNDVIIHGKEIALVQLAPGTSVVVHTKDGKFQLIFDRGQLIKRAA